LQHDHSDVDGASIRHCQRICRRPADRIKSILQVLVSPYRGKDTISLSTPRSAAETIPGFLVPRLISNGRLDAPQFSSKSRQTKILYNLISQRGSSRMATAPISGRS
jgi:hypothetical protein